MMRARSLRVVLLAVLLALLLAPPAGAQTSDEAAIRTWAAPPYWWNVVPQPEGTVAAGREALASGRQPLTPGPTALPFIALPPCRLVDTRGNGAPLTGGFLPPATVRSYTLTGVCGIPANAQAVSLNATVVRPTGPGFLTLWPEGGAFPPVSTLNYVGNDIVANAAVVPLSVAGGVSMALGGSGGDVILDTNGYYAPAGVSSLNALTGDVVLATGGNLTLTPGGNTLTLNTAGTISANLIGNVTGNATGFTGGLGGDVTGTQGATVVGSVGGQTAANVAAGAALANAATTANTANTIVKRDASGNLSATGYKQSGTGGETLRIVRGIFTGGASPTILAGSGFSVARTSVGNYGVTFSTGFAPYPTVSLTRWDVGSVDLINIQGGSFTFEAYNAAGVLADPIAIGFIAIGPP